VNERGKVFDVYQGKDREGQNVIVWSRHNGLNQQWDISYADIPEPVVAFKPNQPFIIVNQMKGKRLLTLSEGNFVIQTRNNSPEQLFKYDPKSQTIVMYANQGHSLSIDHAGRSRDLVGKKTDGAWYQQFVIDGRFIVNERKLVLDVSGS